MKLIVGLGNPTKDYSNTRHNLGANTLIELAMFFDNQDNWQNFDNLGKITDIKVKDETIKLFLPGSFMNLSGEPIKKVMSFYKIAITDLWVIHDELDLPLGSVRLSFSSTSAGHNGVQNIIDALGGNNFWRWRLGVGRPTDSIPGHKFVLLPFSKDEIKTFSEFVSTAANKIKIAIEIGAENFVNKFNQ